MLNPFELARSIEQRHNTGQGIQTILQLAAFHYGSKRPIGLFDRLSFREKYNNSTVADHDSVSTSATMPANVRKFESALRQAICDKEVYYFVENEDKFTISIYDAPKDNLIILNLDNSSSSLFRKSNNPLSDMLPVVMNGCVINGLETRGIDAIDNIEIFNREQFSSEILPIPDAFKKFAEVHPMLPVLLINHNILLRTLRRPGNEIPNSVYQSILEQTAIMNMSLHDSADMLRSGEGILGQDAFQNMPIIRENLLNATYPIFKIMGLLSRGEIKLNNAALKTINLINDNYPTIIDSDELTSSSIDQFTDSAVIYLTGVFALSILERYASTSQDSITESENVQLIAAKTRARVFLERFELSI
jgi:hypothetical protein